jgi:hypothetical protein
LDAGRPPVVHDDEASGANLIDFSWKKDTRRRQRAQKRDEPEQSHDAPAHRLEPANVAPDAAQLLSKSIPLAEGLT